MFKKDGFSFTKYHRSPNSILGYRKNNAGINIFKCKLTLKSIFWSPCLVVKPRKRLELSGTREKHSTTSRVSPYTSSYVLYNRTELNKTFLYLLITGNIVSTNSNSYSFRSFFRWILSRRYTYIHFPGTRECIYQHSYRVNCRTKTTQRKAYSS